MVTRSFPMVGAAKGGSFLYTIYRGRNTINGDRPLLIAIGNGGPAPSNIQSNGCTNSEAVGAFLL